MYYFLAAMYGRCWGRVSRVILSVAYRKAGALLERAKDQFLEIAVFTHENKGKTISDPLIPAFVPL